MENNNKEWQNILDSFEIIKKLSIREIKVDRLTDFYNQLKTYYNNVEESKQQEIKNMLLEIKSMIEISLSDIKTEKQELLHKTNKMKKYVVNMSLKNKR